MRDALPQRSDAPDRHATLRRILIAIALLVAATAAATVYKWVDERGVTQYSEQPPPGKAAREVPVEPSAASTPGPAKSTEEVLGEFERSRRERERASAIESAERDLQRRIDSEDRERCIVARNWLDRLESAGAPIDERVARDREDAKKIARERISRYCR